MDKSPLANSTLSKCKWCGVTIFEYDDDEWCDSWDNDICFKMGRYYKHLPLSEDDDNVNP